MNGRRNGSRRKTDLNVLMIPVTLITGVISWFFCNMLYSAMEGQIPRPIVIALIFAVLYVLLLIVVVIVSMFQREYQGNLVTLLLMLLPGTLAVFAASALFQFLYGLNPGHENAGPTSYIFIIDDSESTLETDKEQLRYKAIEDVLSGEDASMPYMIYSFNNSTTLVREMGPAVDGEHFSSVSSGGTSIRDALETAINDFRNGVWDGGDSPKFVLLTDGYATDIDIFHPVDPVLNEYVDENLSVSTVGLGQADDELMEKIADKTGGVYIPVTEASDLSNAMKTAAVTNSGRDLVSARHMRKLNGLYGFLRILFLTLIGTMMGAFIAYAYGNQDSYIISTIASAVLSLIGALLMEILTGVLHFNHKPAWLILWAFVAATVLLKRYVRGMGTTVLYGINDGGIIIK